MRSLILACALSLMALSSALAHCPVPDTDHHCSDKDKSGKLIDHPTK